MEYTPQFYANGDSSLEVRRGTAFSQRRRSRPRFEEAIANTSYGAENDFL
jgi:hypothetical protein